MSCLVFCLVFVYYYTKVNGYAPAEQDMQNDFKVSPPSVLRMVVELDKEGINRKTAKKSEKYQI